MNRTHPAIPLFPKGFLLVALSLLFLVPASTRLRAASPSVRDWPVPCRGESRYPFLAATQEGTLLMTWLERRSDTSWALRFSEQVGGDWGLPRTIAESDHFFINWADAPSIVQISGDTLAAHWLAMRGEGTYEYDVFVAISADRGRSWSSPESPHRDGVATEHGFLSFFEAASGGAGMVWLDGRALGPVDEETHSVSGAMRLYASARDRSGAWNDEVLLDGRVCECCPTAAARTEDGVVVAYRDRSDREVRNIATVSLWKGKWSRPRPLHKDGWKISGCPVNGPALASDGKTVAAIWFTAPGGDAEVRFARSTNSGRRFGRPVRLDGGKALGRVDVKSLGRGAFAASWIELTEEGAEVRLRVVERSGRLGDAISLGAIASDRGSGYPKLALSRDRLFAAWTETNETSRVTLKLVDGLTDVTQ